MTLLCNIIHKFIIPKNYFLIQDTSELDFWNKIYQAYEPPYSLSIHHFLLFLYISSSYYHKKDIYKFPYFFYEVEKNIFLSRELKDEILTIFNRCKKTYRGFARLANIYKYKKASIKNQTDMYMNEININDPNVITVFHEKYKYLFLISDLIKIINTSLLNSVFFFASPITPKNPYNNLPFNKCELYNIYFKIRRHNVYNPILFCLFFKSNFDLDDFFYNNEAYIRETYIKNYSISTPHYILFNDIKLMLTVNEKYTKNIYIHDDIPKDVLVNIFRPYLHLFYLFRYGVTGTAKRNIAFSQLRDKLKSFVEYNPHFGRKICKVEYSTVTYNTIVDGVPTIKKKHIKKSNVTFNLDHIDFHSQIKIPFKSCFPRTNNVVTPINLNTHIEEETHENSDDDDDDDYDDDDDDDDVTII